MFDIKKQKELNKYDRININEMKNYINSIKNNKYTYENDKMPDEKKLVDDLKIASIKMSERIKDLKSH